MPKAGILISGSSLRAPERRTLGSPIGSFCAVKPDYAHLQGDALLDLKMKQGHPPCTVEMRIDDEGRAMPWDGAIFGI